MNQNNGENGVVVNFLAGVAIGAVLGAAAALLLAPKAGSETREDLKVAVDDLRTKANKVAADLSAATEEWKQRIPGLIDTAKSKVQNAVETGRQAMTQKKQELTEESAGEQGS